MYGPRGLKAFEVKTAYRFRSEDTRGLRAFLEDYPQAGACLLYCGERRLSDGKVQILPAGEALLELPKILS